MFKRIHEYWTNEIMNKQLQRIDANFFKEVNEYFSKLDDEIADASKDDMIKNILLSEKKYAKKLIEDLIKKRINKIIIAIFSNTKIPVENLSEYDMEILKYIRDLKSKVSMYYTFLIPEERLEGQILETKGKFRIQEDKSQDEDHINEKDYLLVRFIKPINNIIGSDLKQYGPFKRGDLAILPKLNAKVLKDRNIAIIVTDE